ncbi:hypothetical protein ACRAWG_15610 [Methylobacterium sp. P31]
MQIRATSIASVFDNAASKSRPARLILATLTVVALVSVGAGVARAPEATVDPDLVRLIRFMALIKGGFALAAFLGSLWRLARPAAAWRISVYIAGPPLMAAGAIGLWSLHDLGIAALGVHLGLVILIAAALTDPDFLPDSLFRRRRHGDLR